MELVKEFHQVFNHPSHNTWNRESYEKSRKLRLELIDEEFGELTDAIEKDDKVEMVDALMDLLYVTFGTAIAFGLSLEDSFVYENKELKNKELKNKEINNDKEYKCIYSVLKGQVESLLYAIREFGDEEKVEENIKYLLGKVVDAIHYMTCFSMCVDLKRAFHEVHESNMTKVCHTEREAQDTLAYHRTRIGDVKDAYYEFKNNYWIVYDRSNGKVLKNVHYKPVNLSWVL